MSHTCPRHCRPRHTAAFGRRSPPSGLGTMGKGYKVVVCGMASVGKTAILEQLLYGKHTVGEAVLPFFLCVVCVWIVSLGRTLCVDPKVVTLGHSLSRGRTRVWPGHISGPSLGLVGPCRLLEVVWKNPSVVFPVPSYRSAYKETDTKADAVLAAHLHEEYANKKYVVP